MLIGRVDAANHGSLLRTRIWNQEDWALAVFEDSFSHAADQEIVHCTMTVPAHHNQVGLNCACSFANFVDHATGRFVRARFKTGPCELFLPVLEFNFLRAISRSCFRQLLEHPTCQS